MAARTTAVAVAAGLVLAAALSSCLRPDKPDSLPRPENLPATAPAAPSALVSGTPPPASAAPTPSAVSTPPTASANASARVSPTPRTPSGLQLRAALLVPGDLPGYSPSNEPDLNGSSSCADLNVDYTAGARVSVTALFAKTSMGPFLRETLVELAAARMDTIVRDFANAPACGTFNGTIPGYGAATFTVSRAGVASYGTATAAVRLTIEPANHLATIVETLVAVRQGTVLMVLTHTGLTDHDDNVTGSATARAYARLRQVA